MRVAQIVEDSISEGPGRRLAIWLQGCSIRCKSCCNPYMLNPEGGFNLSQEEVIRLLKRAKEDGIEGISILGGEPFDQPSALFFLIEQARDLGLGTIIFTGYTISELNKCRDIRDILSMVDLIIDGPYIASQHSKRRRWIGSNNQEIHYISDRYMGYNFEEGYQSIDIHLKDGELTINGWPMEVF